MTKLLDHHRFATLRRYLVAGLLIWVPLGVTLLVVAFLINLMDRTLILIPPPYRPERLFGFDIPGLGAVLLFILVLVTGMLVANLFGRRLVTFWESLLNRIPLVRSVYSGAKQVAETMLSDASDSFKKVYLIEYPRRGIWSMCFQTATEIGELQARTEEEVVCVFVPTTPNPTSGFIVFAPRDDLRELSMSVDEGIKMIISLGVVAPQWRESDLPPTLVHKDTGT
ncbi:MAG: DUF502 domain-containing protein [Gammaproteobacteria bacterium]